MVQTLQHIPRYPTLVSSAVDQLHLYIKEAQLQEGDRLPSQEELAQRFSVSRTVVREAVKGLETLGVLESRRGDGVFVTSFNPKPLAKSVAFGLGRYSVEQRLEYLFEAREQFELNAVGLAIERINPEQHKRIREILEHMRPDRYSEQPALELDYAFHKVVLEASGNPIVFWFGDIIQELFSLLAEYYGPQSEEHRERVYLGHKRIYEAICSGDLKAARQSVSDHLANSRQRWLSPKNSRSQCSGGLLKVRRVWHVPTLL